MARKQHRPEAIVATAVRAWIGGVGACAASSRPAARGRTARWKLNGKLRDERLNAEVFHVPGRGPCPDRTAASAL
jgi:hypothetical protein